MSNFYNISGEYVKKCCLAQLNGIRKRKCSVIREDASQFWGFQARAEIDIQTRRIHIRTLSCFPFLPIGLTFWSPTLAFTVPLRAARNQWRSSFSTEPSERRFNMFIVPNEGFALSRKPHSFRLRKSHVLFPINKEIHSFFKKSPLLPPRAPITRPSGSHPAEDSERIYLMAWLAVGCDLFSCHIAFFLLPPFSSLLPLLHINQRSIVE